MRTTGSGGATPSTPISPTYSRECGGEMMRRDHISLFSPAIGGSGDLIAYGHYGRPLLVFPSEQGRAWDYENNGMIGVLSHLIEAGRLKVYCVDSYDKGSWNDDTVPLEE